MLQIDVPTSAEQTQVTCDIGSAEIWLKAKTTGDNINSGVGVMLWRTNYIRSLEPSRRTTDSREWGPFDDRRHPGFEDLVTLTRKTSGCDSNVSVCYDFTTLSPLVRYSTPPVRGEPRCRQHWRQAGTLVTASAGIRMPV